MQFQLRIYKIKPGLMDEFVEGWRTHFIPLREKHGFHVTGGWVNRDTNEFIWMVRYDGPEGYAAADAAYYAHPDRQAVPWDPMPYIEKHELRIIDPVYDGGVR